MTIQYLQEKIAFVPKELFNNKLKGKINVAILFIGHIYG